MPQAGRCVVIAIDHPPQIDEAANRGGFVTMDRSRLNAADFLRRHCHCGFLFVADSYVRCSRTWKTAPESPLARLWLFAWLSSARTDRKGERPGPRSSLLVWRARLLPWALERRWFRALLDTDTHRTTLELRIADRPMVTVGTAVASRPPHRSRRALLTHRAYMRPPLSRGYFGGV